MTTHHLAHHYIVTLEPKRRNRLTPLSDFSTAGQNPTINIASGGSFQV